MNSSPASVAGCIDFSAIAGSNYMNSSPASVVDELTSQVLLGGSI